MKTPELELHRSVAEFMEWVVLPPALWTTFPAGWTSMRPGAAGRLKGCGLKAGMPDILVFYNSFTIGIELKTPSRRPSRPSPEQLDMHSQLQAAGVPVSVCRSIGEVERILRTYKIPLRKFSHGEIPYTTPKGCRSQEPAQGAAHPTP